MVIVLCFLDNNNIQQVGVSLHCINGEESPDNKECRTDENQVAAMLQ